MKRTWTCDGFHPVEAHTKGEARSLFKEQARQLESLTFEPKKVTRLPAGTRVQPRINGAGECKS